jgi:hypothetical protein
LLTPLLLVVPIVACSSSSTDADEEATSEHPQCAEPDECSSCWIDPSQPGCKPSCGVGEAVATARVSSESVTDAGSDASDGSDAGDAGDAFGSTQVLVTLSVGKAPDESALSQSVACAGCTIVKKEIKDESGRVWISVPNRDAAGSLRQVNLTVPFGCLHGTGGRITVLVGPEEGPLADGATVEAHAYVADDT